MTQVQMDAELVEVDREEICGGGCELPEGSCPACLGAI